VLILLAAAAGYVAGTLIALFLDRMYTGAPIRGPIRLCEHGSGNALLWTGMPGYLLTRGKTPDGCRAPARLWYLPLVGLLAGVLIAVRATDARQALLVSAFSLVLLAFVGTDFERHLLPNRLMYPSIVIAIALCWAWPGRTPNEVITGGMLGFGVMFVVSLIMPGFGLGDVKLAALLGLLAGISNTMPALAAGMIAGGIASGIMLATRRAGRRTAMAYGPYLALGAFLGMLTR
jgi:leader peptidase (prepilin peptidase)/N-methyltransferase